MQSGHERALIQRRFAQEFGASVQTGYTQFLTAGTPGNGAVLGYRRAGAEPLFLESYLDDPVEEAVSRAFGRTVLRPAIVEIGNLASDNALATIGLWGSTANDLGAQCEVAVATLTVKVRAMFARIGIPVRVLAPARCDVIAEAALWGRYYDGDPQVCAGFIAEGQSAIAACLSRRAGRAA